jgi:magnesium transporter
MELSTSAHRATWEASSFHGSINANPHLLSDASMLTIYSNDPTDEPRSKSPKPFWVDLLDPTPDEAARMAVDYSIQVPSRDALQEIESSSRLRSEEQVLYLSMPLTVQDRVGLAPVPLGFILSPQLLVTVRYSEVPAFDQVRSQLETTHMSGAAAFAALIDAMVDNSADMLEKLSSNLAAVSARVFGRNVASPISEKRFSLSLRDSLNTVGTAGDDQSRIRESLLGLQRIIGFVSERALEWLAPDLVTRLKTARQDLMSLIDFEGHLAGKTQFLLDAILGYISTEQNDIFKVLTIASVVGIPPTLIASMYGMNFHNMPELGWRWGYPYGLVLIALSTIIPIVWFKRRGWW